MSGLTNRSNREPELGLDTVRLDKKSNLPQYLATVVMHHQQRYDTTPDDITV